MHNVIMPGARDHPEAHGSRNLWPEKRVQFSRGHWRSEEGTGANVTSFMPAIALTVVPCAGDMQ